MFLVVRGYLAHSFGHSQFAQVHFGPSFDNLGEAHSRIVFGRRFFDANFVNFANDFENSRHAFIRDICI